MEQADMISFFFQKKWPNGYYCPRCGGGSCYEIATRRLPLYQCRYCKHQTTVTAGTVMEKSRTPLSKWADAIELLSYTNGINAVRLSEAIGVSHKTAWNMLRRIRHAISAVESKRLLRGTVHAGLVSLGRWHQTYVRHPQEHVLIIGATMDPDDGQPSFLKLRAVPDQDAPSKQLTRQGERRFQERHVHAQADACIMLKRVHLHRFNPLKQCFYEAQAWLNRLFHGLGSTYLQTYLDEYCFRKNTIASGKSPRDEWYTLCLTPTVV